MTLRPAYDEIVLEHGSHAVILRPSLRAASALEHSHNGLANLFRRVEEFHTGTVREIIITAATDRKDAAVFLHSLESKPLAAFQRIAQIPAFQLVAGFIPQSDEQPAPDARPVPWPEVYRQLYCSATAWLGWPPEAAWNATPTEITDAFNAHIAKLKTLNGVEDDTPSRSQPDPEQAARNIADGLDPEFDRAGLRALKAKYGRRR